MNWCSVPGLSTLALLKIVPNSDGLRVYGKLMVVKFEQSLVSADFGE